jgi:hypothetical protein
MEYWQFSQRQAGRRDYRPFEDAMTRPNILAGLAAIGVLAGATPALADQGGVPFWFSGQVASLSATAPSPGWTLGVLGYDYVGSASKTFQFGPTVVANIHTEVPVPMFQLGYAPKTTLFGAQPYIAMAFGAGYNNTTAGATLSNPPTALSRTDSMSGATDLYPYASLSWVKGVSNWMVYATGDIPVGDYQPGRLANLGIGHGAADLGAGYTYLNQKSGLEFTMVTGFTFNAPNTSTQYTNGVDYHLDWALSQFLSASWEVGVVGYVYDQISADSGAGDRLGAFESKIAAAGPEIGHPFAAYGRAGYINLRAYWEFGAVHRVEGRAVYLTVAIPLGPSPKK